MKSFVRLTDFSKEELLEIFSIADNIGEYKNFLREKTVVLFFPSTSLRTRVSFEKGIHLLGGQAILFEPSTILTKAKNANRYDNDFGKREEEKIFSRKYIDKKE